MAPGRLTRSCYYSFGQGFGTPTFSISTMDTGLFVQDNWKVTPRLTMELAYAGTMRLCPVPFPRSLPPLPRTASPLSLPGLNNSPTDKTNFGPRIGFSYDVTGKGNTVVRGGYGIITAASPTETCSRRGSAPAVLSGKSPRLGHQPPWRSAVPEYRVGSTTPLSTSTSCLPHCATPTCRSTT